MSDEKSMHDVLPAGAAYNDMELMKKLEAAANAAVERIPEDAAAVAIILVTKQGQVTAAMATTPSHEYTGIVGLYNHGPKALTTMIERKAKGYGVDKLIPQKP